MAYSSVPAEGDEVGKACVAVGVVFWTIALVSIILRVVAARVKCRSFEAHDYCAFVALFFAAGIVICYFIQVFMGGIGLPADAVTQDSFVLGQKLIPVVEILWSVSNTAVKLSFLHFFSVVFSLQRYQMRFIMVAVICILYGLANIIQAVAVCQPYAYLWDKTIPGGHCGYQSLGLVLGAIFNLVTDLCIFLLPVPILWALKGLSARKRGELIMVFCLGSFVCCITILRIGITIQLNNVDGDGDGDATYWVGLAAVFLALEPCLGITAACFPAWRPLCARRDPESGSRNFSYPRGYGLGRRGYARNNSSNGHGGVSHLDTVVSLTGLAREFHNVAKAERGGTTCADTTTTTAGASFMTAVDEQPEGEGITVTTDVMVDFQTFEMLAMAKNKGKT